MKKSIKLSVIVLLLISFALLTVSCGGNTGKNEETTVSVEETTEKTQETTVIEDTTVEETTAEQTTVVEDTTAEETTEAIDPNDPRYNLIEVGMSADGKTPCYDGRYMLEEEVYLCNDDGATFQSIQEAFDYLEGFGGNLSLELSYADVGACFNVTVPDDGNFYRFAYNWANCDYVFNYGVTYDDCTPLDSGDWIVNGYAYYSDLEVLDDIAGLDDSYIYVWSNTEGLAAGLYHMTETPSGDLNYTYEKVGELSDRWPGLPGGQTLKP